MSASVDAMTDAKAAPMNMTIRKEALRDQRAKMLAAAPDWRASDARVNPRVAIGSILAMWLLYFLITTGLGLLAGAEQWEYAGRRALVVVAVHPAPMWPLFLRSSTRRKARRWRIFRPTARARCSGR